VVEHLHAGLRIGHRDVHVHAALAGAGGEIAEAFPHAVVPGVVDDPGVRSGRRRRAHGDDAYARPRGRIGHPGPQRPHRVVQLPQLESRRPGHLDHAALELVLHRLPQLVGQLAEDVVDGLHGVRLDRIDQQILLFDAERQQVV
jgi:hypothetical protein